jgi:hypothetical protein
MKKRVDGKVAGRIDEAGSASPGAGVNGSSIR